MKRKARDFKPGDMPPKEIKRLLFRYDETQVGIARALGISKQVVHHVIEGKVASDRVRRAVCAAIRKHPKEVWPSAYLGRLDPPKPGRPRSEASERVSNCGL